MTVTDEKAEEPTAGDAFRPELLTITTAQRPTPLLPISYDQFRRVTLPEAIETLSLAQQLDAVRAAVRPRLRYLSYSAFGALNGFRFRSAPRETLYLNALGEFADWNSPTASVQTSGRSGGSRMRGASGEAEEGKYVVGYRTALLPQVQGDHADDLDLEAARKFTVLDDAVEASELHGGSVFKIVTEHGETKLRELMVDLGRVAGVPYDRCYRIGDHLLIGPSFVRESEAETQVRIAALVAAQVSAVISLVDRNELFEMRAGRRSLRLETLFRHSYFPIRNGDAPAKELMCTILDEIESLVVVGDKVFLHCGGGRGRSGCVAGCLLARHGIATGVGALNTLGEMRYGHGLFTPSPETKMQRQLVSDWKAGE